MIATEDVVVLVQAIKDNAQRLGLVWQMRLATVMTPSPLTLKFDGDTVVVDNDIVNVTGTQFARDDRVYVISVPPAGNYVIGQATITYGKVITPGARIGTLGQTGAEASLSLASWLREPRTIAPPQTVMKVTLMIPMFINNALNSTHIVRLRVGSLTISGTQLLQWNVPFQTTAVTLVNSMLLEGYFKNATDIVRNTALSVTLATGTGSALVGAYSDNNLPLELAIEPYCPVALDPLFSGGLVQV